MKLSLPIDAHLPEMVAHLRSAPNLVIAAEPGAGKTTRVPPALLEHAGEVWVLEPRRLAARLAARRVAGELGERLGETVGYQVRFEEVAGPRTRLRFLTEGVLTRRLLSDPQLKKVRCVVLDEFHERHLQTDVALAWLRRLQMTTRPDLQIVVMSATLDAAPVAEYLGGAQVVSVEGRQFPVTIEYLSRLDERPLEKQVAAALRKLEHMTGDVLVFLPGAAEIRRAAEACAELAQLREWLVLPLHGELAAEAQDRAVRPAERRKIILATNVAESSVTIEGVGAVIDSGLERTASHSAWTGLRQLKTGRISQASAAQRAGRAGRTRAGVCLRLYTQQDLQARPLFATPELLRLDLAETVLALHAAGVSDSRTFPWFAAPPESAMAAAETLLQKIGAIDNKGELKDEGRRMARFPLHPRLGRVLVECERHGLHEAGSLLVALLNERDPRTRNLMETGARLANSHGPSDMLALMDLFHAAATPEQARRLGLEVNAWRAIERTRRQLVRSAARSEPRAVNAEPGTDSLKNKGVDAENSVHPRLSPVAEDNLLRALLAGFPDRVARRRAHKSGELLLCGGGAAQLAPESVVRQEDFVVALDAEERTGALPLVRRASKITPEWLLDLFPGDIRERDETLWNATNERVETVSRWYYGQVIIEESRNARATGAAVSAKLAEMAANVGWAAFVEREAVARWLARVAFLAYAWPEQNVPELDETAPENALRDLCGGRRSFAQLREAARNGEFFQYLQQNLSAEQLRLLAQMAPERVALPNARQVRVNYEAHQAPWIASRLQDFFGLKETPCVAGGRVSLVVHLLAPNHRPVQVTNDLAGFWVRHYPALRRALSRRYPKHAWPENPA